MATRCYSNIDTSGLDALLSRGMGAPLDAKAMDAVVGGTETHPSALAPPQTKPIPPITAQVFFGE